MKRLVTLLTVLLIACSDGAEEEAADDVELAPIGPGSDSSALVPPDTPESRVRARDTASVTPQ
jgi:hypothetical protein